jgi:hypothetical protein
MFLNVEENPVWKAAHSRAATASMDDRKLQRMFRNAFNYSLDRLRKALAKLWTNVVIPSPSLQQILIRVWSPNDRERHCFLSSPVLTCCQGITAEGFCSWRAIR